MSIFTFSEFHIPKVISFREEKQTVKSDTDTPPFIYRVTSDTSVFDYRLPMNFDETSTESIGSSRIEMPGKDIELFLKKMVLSLDDDENIDELSLDLWIIIKKWGHIAIDTLVNFIRSGKIKGLAITRTLELIGDLRHSGSHFRRRKMLEWLLFDPSLRIRDGACLGLSLLNDQLSLPVVQKAIQQEKIPELQINLINLEQQLKISYEIDSFHKKPS